MVPEGSTMEPLFPFTRKETEAQDTKELSTWGRNGAWAWLPTRWMVRFLKEEAPAPTGSRPLSQPCSLAPPPIPLLYDLFYEHGLAASMLPWEPASAGSWQLDLGLAILSRKPILEGGGGPRVEIYAAPGMHSACLPPLLCSSSQVPRSSRDLAAGRS